MTHTFTCTLIKKTSHLFVGFSLSNFTRGRDTVENPKEDFSAEAQKCTGKENIEKNHLLKPPPILSDHPLNYVVHGSTYKEFAHQSMQCKGLPLALRLRRQEGGDPMDMPLKEEPLRGFEPPTNGVVPKATQVSVSSANLTVALRISPKADYKNPPRRRNRFVPSRGFEPPTNGLGNRCSIHTELRGQRTSQKYSNEISYQRENHVRISAPARVACSTLRALVALYLDVGNSSTAPASQNLSATIHVHPSPSFVRLV